MCNGKSEKAEEMEGQAVVDLGNEVRNRFFQLSKKNPHCAAQPASTALFHPRALVKTQWNICLVMATGGEPRNISPQSEKHVVCSYGIVKRLPAGIHQLRQIASRTFMQNQ